MTKWLILWEPAPIALPTNLKDLNKLRLQMLEVVKADIQKGIHTDWGLSADGTQGYAISEGTEQEIFTALGKFAPYITFKAIPVLSVDEVIAFNQQALQGS
ncbi:MAG: hypothetical protein NWE83_08075 [Candidatus Bathyarchaeota archaeon]|nr:hypothetical protein [Candidatus Bathyarchaeota archaeon]